MTRHNYPGDVKIVCLGEVLWDEVDGRRYIGGAPLNLAYHAGRAGAQARIISRVGRDDLGTEAVRKAGEIGLDLTETQRDDALPTGLVKAEAQADGSAEYVFQEECAWDHIRFGERERELIDAASVVVFGTLAQRHYVSRAAIMGAVASAPATAEVFLDLNLREPYFKPEIVRASLEAATILKVNDGEFGYLKSEFDLDGDDPAAALQLMDRFGLSTLVVTHGPGGASAWRANEYAAVDGVGVDVADTIGCGDAFAGCFIVQVSTGASLEKALTEAALISAYVATRRGGTPAYTAEDIAAFRKEVM